LSFHEALLLGAGFVRGCEGGEFFVDDAGDEEKARQRAKSRIVDLARVVARRFASRSLELCRKYSR
jgi:hypothetical protein